MSDVTVAGMVVEVSEGTGTPVVLLHGLGGTSNTFQPQMDVLRDHRVVRVDLPGAGRSPAGAGALSIEGFVDAIVRAAGVLGIERAHFGGHSMGALICQHIAVSRPGLVASLLLFGSVIEPPEALRTALQARARLARSEGMAGIAEQIVANALSADTRTNRPAAAAFVRESVLRQDPEGYARHCEALAKAQAADHRLISAPALIVAGETDATAPASVARSLAERLKGATLAVVEGSGHWMTIEKPLECNQHLRAFLQRTS